MKYFVVVAEQLSFRRAAERLFISQPTLSHQIAQTEKALGVRLLERDRRHVALTEAGAAFLERARAILSRTDQAAAHARWTGGLPGAGLRVGCATHDSRVAGRLLEAFRQDHPGVWLDERVLDSAAQVWALRARTLDVGLVHAPVDARLAVEPAPLQQPFVAVPRGHRLAQLKQVPLQALQQERFLMLAHRSFSRHYRYLTALFRTAGSRPGIVWLQPSEPSDLHALLLMVAIGRGLTILTMSAPQTPPAGVALRPLRPPRAQRTLAIASRPDDPSLLVAAFLKTARNLTAGAELAEA